MRKITVIKLEEGFPCLGNAREISREISLRENEGRRPLGKTGEFSQGESERSGVQGNFPRKGFGVGEFHQVAQEIPQPRDILLHMLSSSSGKTHQVAWEMISILKRLTGSQLPEMVRGGGGFGCCECQKISMKRETQCILVRLTVVAEPTPQWPIL